MVLKGNAVACGRCIACRVLRRRTWTSRILLESFEHADNTFLTLTYNDEHLPEDQSVDPAELKRFLMRLRKSYGKPIRYFAVGEYGEKSQRPHYHAILFGYPNCERGRTEINQRTGKCCSSCDRVAAAWRDDNRLPLGHIMLAEVNPQTAQYCAGYVVKKLTKDGDPELGGRHPEFARMSNRPGLGCTFTDDMADTLLKHDLHKTLDDVPRLIRHSGKLWPLGDYLVEQLRLRIGRDRKVPQKVKEENEKEMREVQKAAFENSQSFAFALAEHQKGTRIKLENRERRNRKRETL